MLEFAKEKYNCIEDYFALAEELDAGCYRWRNQINKGEIDGLKRLVRDVLGLPRPIHNYFICEECKTEYYQKHRPKECEKCGYSGGVFINPGFGEARMMSMNILKQNYRYTIDLNKEKILNFISGSCKTNVMEGIGLFFSENDLLFVRSPRSFLYAMAATDEILIEYGLKRSGAYGTERIADEIVA